MAEERFEYPLFAYYNLAGAWCVANADLTPTPFEIAFNVLLAPRGTVQAPTASSAAGNQFAVDDPIANGQPDAILFAMPVSGAICLHAPRLTRRGKRRFLAYVSTAETC
jgi:hypothetical protein